MQYRSPLAKIECQAGDDLSLEREVGVERPTEQPGKCPVAGHPEVPHDPKVLCFLNTDRALTVERYILKYLYQ